MTCRFLSGASVLLLLLLSSCGAGDSTHEVRFFLGGNARSPQAVYQLPTGTVQTEDVVLPWTASFIFEDGDSLDLAGHGEGQGLEEVTLTCQIFVDGELHVEDTVTDILVVPRCRGIVGQ